MNTQRAVIVPSLLSADMGRLADAVALLEEVGCELFHLDVMDGHFVPNLTFGPSLVQALSAATKKAMFSVHLMVSEPERLLPRFMTERVRYLTVHVEACPHLHRTLQQIRELGARAGVALNPGTAPWAVEYVLGEADLVLVMTVNPGWGGQAFIDTVLGKIETLADWGAQREGFNYVVEVDGGIDVDTAPRVLKAGARLLVAGSAIYSASDPVQAYRALSALTEPYP